MKNVVTISLCLIVKNEQSVLENCLSSVNEIADEIIIVDTGSEDDTKLIASRYTDRIYDFTWVDDFSSARNYSFSLATSDYILWLDADDVLLETDRAKLIQLKMELDSSTDAVSMIYHYAFDEYGHVTMSLRRNRLVKREKGFRWHGAVHEFLAVEGAIMNSDIVVTHRRVHRQSARNLSIFESRRERGESFSPRDLYYYGNELLDHELWDKAAKVYEQFLQTEQGWQEDRICALQKLSDIYDRLGKPDKQAACLWKTFDYGEPRAEVCCRLGAYFYRKEAWAQAIFWYRMAVLAKKPPDGWGFSYEAYWTWIPHLQLCVCYYRIGEFAKSYYHNEMAGRFRPEDPHVLYNRKLLEGVINDEAL